MALALSDSPACLTLTDSLTHVSIYCTSLGIPVRNKAARIYILSYRTLNTPTAQSTLNDAYDAAGRVSLRIRNCLYCTRLLFGPTKYDKYEYCRIIGMGYTWVGWLPLHPLPVSYWQFFMDDGMRPAFVAHAPLCAPACLTNQARPCQCSATQQGWSGPVWDFIVSCKAL